MFGINLNLSHLQKQLADNETHVQLTNLEKKWSHLEQNNFTLAEFVANRKAELNFEPVKNKGCGGDIQCCRGRASEWGNEIYVTWKWEKLHAIQPEPVQTADLSIRGSCLISSLCTWLPPSYAQFVTVAI